MPDGVTPVANAPVIAYSFNTGLFADSSITASDGSYILKGIPSGDFRVQVDATHLGFVMECYQDRPLCENPSPVTVVAPRHTFNIDFILEVGGTISGIVLESNEVTRVPYSAVSAFDFATGLQADRVGTDINGNYTLRGLPSGKYRVQADARSYGFVLECYQDDILCRTPSPVNVFAPTDTPNINFTLVGGGTISGTVLESDGVTPVTNTYVYAYDPDSGSGNYAYLSSNGSYTIRGLLSGAYRVQVYAVDQGLVFECYRDDLGCQNPTPVAVALGADTPNIDFTLEVGGTISGTVQESDGVTPVVNAYVYASPINNGSGSSTRTSANGTYTIEGLASGAYRVQLDATAQGFMRECYRDDLGCQNPTPVAVALGANTPNIDYTLEVGGTISGTVLESDGVTPVANAFVRASEVNIGSGASTRTDADGDYDIQALASGTYRVQVDARDQGFLYECYQDDLLCQNPTPVAVALGADTPNIDFTLEVGGTISGTVLESDGVTPVANAFVRASEVNIGSGASTRTDADGDYDIQALASGTYRVQVDARDQGFLLECYQDDLLCQNPAPVAVALGANTPNIDFTLEVGSSISGTVLESDGVTPVADVYVEAYDPNSGYGSYAYLSSDGSYTIQGLASGNYRVQVDARSQGFLYECYQDDLLCQNPAPVAVALGADTPNIDFTLEVGGTISGTVLESDGVTPVANVYVQAYDPNSGYGSYAYLSSDGSYTIQGLASGEFRVQVDARDQGFLYECYQDDLLCQNPTPVAVALGADTPNIDFTLEVGGTISGTVLESDGVTPVTDAFVRAIELDLGIFESSGTASDGSYTFQGLAPGDYLVQVNASDQGFAPECYRDDISCGDPTLVAVTLGSDTPNIDFTLEVGGTISGTVLESDGVTPVTDAYVYAFEINSGYGNYVYISSDGSYTIPGLASGDYQVQAYATEQGFVVECYRDDLLCQNPTPVAVVQGADTPNIDFTLELGGTISGTVLESDGVTPVANAYVYAFEINSGYGNYAYISSDGSYTIPGLASGDYQVQAYATEQGFVVECYRDDLLCQNPTPVVVVQGADTPNINFTLVVGGTISGRVMEPDGTPVASARVRAYNFNTGHPATSTRTAFNGSYTLLGLPSGEFRVEADATHEGLVLECYQNDHLCQNPSPVSVVSPDDTPNIDFTLETGGTISGVVREADGVTPVGGAIVFAFEFNTGLLGDRAGTDANGVYTLQGLPSGDFRVEVDATDQGFLLECYQDNVQCQNPTRVSVVSPADTTNIDFTLDVVVGGTAEPSLAILQDQADGATGFKVAVTRVIDPNPDSEVNALLGDFQSRLSYPDASANPEFPAGTRCVNMLDVREMDIPMTVPNIDNAAGIATFDGSAASGVLWPADLGHALTRLTGSANQQCQVDLQLTSLSDVDGNPIAVPTMLSQTVQRGDARADGKVTIADALFIAQYLVGSRPACTTVVDTTCLHSVNAASVRQDGAFDKKTIADALFIAQYLVGLRDENYTLVP